MSTFEMFRDNKKKNIEDDISERYNKLSSRCSVLKWVSLIVLVCYVLISVSLHGDKLSFNSIRYIVKYMKEDPFTLVVDGESFKFDYDASNKVYKIGSDFSVLGKNTISIFDFSGKLLFSDNTAFENPLGKEYKNELCVYEIGKKEIRFYDSYSLTERLTFEEPIYDVSISQNGYFLVMTASSGYKSGYRVYKSKSSELVRKNFGNTDLQTSVISKDGSLVYASSIQNNQNNVLSVIQIYDNSSKDPLISKEINGEYPIYFSEIGKNIIFLTNKALRFYDSNLNEISSHIFSDKKPLKFKISEDKAIVTYLLSTFSNDTALEIYDEGGVIQSKILLKSSVFDVEICSDKVYCLSDNTVDIFSMTDGKKVASDLNNKIFNSFVRITDTKFLLVCPDEVRIYFSNK